MFGRTYVLRKRGDRARDQMRWSLAEDAYRRVLERRPGHAAIWVQLGHTLKEQLRLNEAFAAYCEADRIRPNHADTLQQIGRMLRRLGREEEAISIYERALALRPDLKDAKGEAHSLQAWVHSRQNPRLAGLPERLRYVILGTTGTCNASCIHCPTGKLETQNNPRTPMPMPLFRKIIDEIAELGLPITDQVSFGLFGDGLVDPYVVERAKYLMERLPHTRIWVNTNGAAFNAKKHSALKDYAFTIALHCESLDPAVYNDLMRPLRAERVFPKFEEILKTFPGQVLVSVPVSKRNLGELPAIRQWFLDRGAKWVEFDPLMSRCSEDRTVFDSLALGPGPIRCSPEIMDDLIVDCDGYVLMCCQDFKRAEGIGNLKTESLADALVGLRRANTRKLLAEGRHEELSTCSRCYADNKITV